MRKYIVRLKIIEQRLKGGGAGAVQSRPTQHYYSPRLHHIQLNKQNQLHPPDQSE